MSNTISALILRTDDTFEKIDLDVPDMLGGLYKAIGDGCTTVDVIDFPDLPGNATMWLDDEGLYHRPKRNELACRLYAQYTGVDPSDVMLVGHVVLTGGTDDEGHTVGLLPESCDFVMSQLGLADV